MKQAVEKTNREAGDGTTTTVALLLSIIEHGLKSSGSSFEIIKGLHNCKQRIISQLQEQAKKIESKEQVEWIASLSAQDSEIGKLIADIVEDIGYDGVISVEEGKQMGLEKEIVTGMGFDEGYDSHYFVTDVARMEAIIEHPYILVTNHTISSVKDIIGIFDQIAESGRKDVVIVANEVKGDALNALVQNKMKGLLNIVTVRCPGTGDQKNKFLEDLAVVTGATFVNRDLDMDLESVSLNMLGQADRVVSKKNETMIVSGKGSKEEIARHVEKLKEMKRNEKTDNGKNMITGRIARLS